MKRRSRTGHANGSTSRWRNGQKSVMSNLPGSRGHTVPRDDGQQALPIDGPIHVAGHLGLVGSAIWRHLQDRGHTALLGWTSAELDLRDREAVFACYEHERPQVVVLAAARVGGILA